MEKRNREELIVVLDTNIIISYLWGSKNADRIFELLFTGKVRPAVSEAVLRELQSVGLRGKFKKRFSPDIFQAIVGAYRDIAFNVVPKNAIALSADKNDDIFLECAFEAKADYLITGDFHLLRIGNYAGIHIVKPADFLRLTAGIEDA